MHNVIVETVFGSHLYGLNTNKSDMDYKGVVLPTPREIMLGNSKFHLDKSTNKSNSKNSASDVDRTFYSLSYFVDMACKGETVALDMLHGYVGSLVCSSATWESLVENRSKFYTKSMKSYVGYVYKQAAKYGVRGSRIAAIEEVISVLRGLSSDLTVVKVSDSLPCNDYCKYVQDKKNPNVLYYEVCASKFAMNLRIGYVCESLETKLSNYGERARLAKLNLGVDWKAISHSLRVAYQVKSIFENGSFSYPLKENDFILKVKLGQLDFTTEVGPELDKLVARVHKLSDESTLPDTVNRKYWDDFIIDVHKNVLDGRV